MENETNYWQQALRRRLSRRRLLQAGAAAGLSLAVGLPAVGCDQSTQQSSSAKGTPSPQAGQPKLGGILKIGYEASRGYLHPGASSNSKDPNWYFLIGDGLVYTAPDGSPDPESSLAASWKKEDDTTFTFNLRQGVKFHDGTAYDAQAQKAYFEYLLDDKRSKDFAYRDQISTIKTMDVVDKYALRIGLKQAFPALLANLGGPPGIPVSPTAIEKLGPDIITRPSLTGPFTIKSFTPGGDWVLEKNANYWRKGRPYLDGVTITEIPDDNVRAASIKSGNVDLAFFSTAGDITEGLKKEPNLVVSEIPVGPAVLRINHALPPLDNLKVRQAIASCIDREAMLKVVYQGIGQSAKGGLMPPGSWSYADVSDVLYKFDTNQAKKYIQESGLKTPISLKYCTSSTPADRLLTAQLMKGWLTDAGFDVSLDVVAETEMNRRFLDEGTYHLINSSAGVRADPDALYSIYVTSTSYYNGGRKSQDPVQKQLDDLVKQAASTYDQNERKKAYSQIERVMAQNFVAQSSLVYRFYVEAHLKNVKGTENFWNPAWSSFRPQFLWKE